jgi:hypothetical protein
MTSSSGPVWTSIAPYSEEALRLPWLKKLSPKAAAPNWQQQGHLTLQTQLDRHQRHRHNKRLVAYSALQSLGP